MTDTSKTRRNRIMLIVLFGIAILPLLGAYWLYQSTRTSKPWGTTNRGELMNPIVSVGDLQLTSIDGKASMMHTGHWWLVVTTKDGCTAECQRAAHQLNQLHILLGRDASRVERGLIALGATPIDQAVVEKNPTAIIFNAPVDVLMPGVYIVDPLGNVVLRYAYGDADKPVLQDLKQLLKVSHIG